MTNIRDIRKGDVAVADQRDSSHEDDQGSPEEIGLLSKRSHAYEEALVLASSFQNGLESQSLKI